MQLMQNSKENPNVALAVILERGPIIFHNVRDYVENVWHDTNKHTIIYHLITAALVAITVYQMLSVLSAFIVVTITIILYAVASVFLQQLRPHELPNPYVAHSYLLCRQILPKVQHTQGHDCSDSEEYEKADCARNFAK